MKLKLQSRWGTPLVLLAAAAVVTACGGGGGGSGSAPKPQNGPTISAIPAQTINQETPSPALAFTVNGGSGAVIVTVSSSDSTLLPTSGLVLGGTGANRTITVTPGEDATGVGTVTLTAVDSQGNASNTAFPVRVNAVSQSVAAFTNATFALMEGDMPVSVSGFTFVQDADDEATFAPLLQ